MANVNKDFLLSLAGAPSPSGFEEYASMIWRDGMMQCSPNVAVTPFGNSIALAPGTGDFARLMFTAHIDTVGFIVTYIDKKGFLYFQSIGGVERMLYSGQKVSIITRKNKEILGVIGRKATHQLTKSEKNRVVSQEKMFIDTGMDYGQVINTISVGDYGTIATFPIVLDDRVVAGGLDDKSGCYVIYDIFRRLSHIEPHMYGEVFGAATVQEELGYIGAYGISYGINPEIAIAIDVIFANDHPNSASNADCGEIKLGGGPVIALGASVNNALAYHMIDVAKDIGIPYQISAQHDLTGTDATAYAKTRNGIVSGLVSIPLRYMHSPSELVDLNDIENTGALLTAVAMRIGSLSDYIPVTNGETAKIYESDEGDDDYEEYVQMPEDAQQPETKEDNDDKEQS